MPIESLLLRKTRWHRLVRFARREGWRLLSIHGHLQLHKPGLSPISLGLSAPCAIRQEDA